MPATSPTSTDADAGAEPGSGGTTDDDATGSRRPTPEECGRRWRQAVGEVGELTLSGLAEHVAAYEAAGCDEVCGPLIGPADLGSPCRPTPET